MKRNSSSSTGLGSRLPVSSQHNRNMNMDLSITYPTFFKNLKFWCLHTLINSIPSIILAYMHDWNTVESFIAFFLGGNSSVEKLSHYSGMLWMPDLITGIISHGFYDSMRNVIPIRGIHEFIPTVIMTLIQGVLLMSMLLIAGVFLAAIGLVFSRANKI